VALIAGVGERALGWNAPSIQGLLPGFKAFRAAEQRFNIAFPDTFSWRAQGKTCRPFDQGQTPTCVGGAIAAGCYTAMLASGIPFDGIPSPAVVWKGTRAREQAAFLLPGAGTSIQIPSIQESGCATADGLLWLAQEGLARMTLTQTPDGRFYDLWGDADVASLPSPPSRNTTIALSIDELSLARQKLLLGPTYLDNTDPNFNLNLKAALLLGPVWWGGYVDTPVFNYTNASAPIPPCNMNDPKKGGHLMVIQGWRPSILGNNTDDWEVQDSWSEDFGDGGYVWGRQDWAKSGTDLYAANLLKAA
jgi:hypothetical protein